MSTDSLPGRYRVVCLDGGGLHGLLPALLLRDLERRRPGFLASVHCFAGTSAGGIMALALAAADDPAEMLERCIDFWHVPNLFSNTTWGWLSAAAGFGSIFSNHVLSDAICRLIGPRLTLRQLNRDVVIPIVSVDNPATGSTPRRWGEKIIYSLPGPWNANLPEAGSWEISKATRMGTGGSIRALDLALSTSAAPVGMPIYGGATDGGLFANTPNLCALTVVAAREMTLNPPAASSPTATGAALEGVRMISFSTGVHRSYVRAPADHPLSWGWGRWIATPHRPLRLLDMVADVNQDITNFYTCFLIDQYERRIAPELREDVSLADPRRAIPLLYSTAERTDVGYALGGITSQEWWGVDWSQ